MVIKTMSLEFVNVCFHYEGKTTNILNDVSLKLNEGERVAIVGHNGSGKSTLILHANGILRPQEGSIFVNDCRIQYNHRSLMSLRRQVGIVFQNPDEQLFSASVLQDLSFGALNLGLSQQDAYQRVMEIATLCNCTHLLSSPTFALSGGEKALVALAGVLVMKPTFLFADEFIGSLDVWMQEQVLSIFDLLREEGVCVILASHDFNFVLNWAERVIYLQDGVIRYQGNPLEVFSQMKIPGFVFERRNLA